MERRALVMDFLAKKLVRLAYQKPELRPELLPLLTATFYREEKSPEDWSKRDRKNKSLPTGEGEQSKTVLNRVKNKNDKPKGQKIVVREVQNNPPSGRVIPENKDFVNKKQWTDWKRKDYQKNAVKISDIERRTGIDIKTRSRSYRPRLLSVNEQNSIWTYRVGDHKVKVKADFDQSGLNFSTVDVKIACECSFWRWQGPEHWARKNGYLLGRPRGTASKPTVKDPKGDHRCCKHVAAVFRVLEQYKGSF